MRSQPEALLCEILIIYSLALLKMTCQEFFQSLSRKLKSVIVVIVFHGFNRAKKITIPDLTEEIVVGSSS